MVSWWGMRPQTQRSNKVHSNGLPFLGGGWPVINSLLQLVVSCHHSDLEKPLVCTPLFGESVFGGIVKSPTPLKQQGKLGLASWLSAGSPKEPGAVPPITQFGTETI